MQRLYIEFSADAAQDDDVLRGVVIDYSDTGEQRGWNGKHKYRVKPGGIEFARAVILNLQHDHHQPVAGYPSQYLALSDGEEQLTMELRYPETPHGRSARDGVKTGIFTGLSAELDDVSTRIDGDITYIEKAVLDGIGLVTRPAFGKSRFFDDRAVVTGQTMRESFPVGIAYQFQDILTGLLRWGTIGVVSASERRAIQFASGSLVIPPYVAFTLGSDYNGIVASTENGNLEVEETPEGIGWKLSGIARTQSGRDLRALIADQLIRGFTFGIQRQESEFTTTVIDGVEYELEVVKRGTLCEVRSNSTMMGGSGEVETPLQRHARYRRRARLR